MSTNEVSKSQLRKLHKARFSMWSTSNDAKIITLLLLCACSWKSSIFYSQSSKEKVRLSPFFVSGSTETCFWTTRKGIKTVVLTQGLNRGSLTPFKRAISGLRTFCIMHTDDCRLTVSGSCSLTVSFHLGSRFYSKIHTLTAGPIGAFCLFRMHQYY